MRGKSLHNFLKLTEYDIYQLWTVKIVQRIQLCSYCVFTIQYPEIPLKIWIYSCPFQLLSTNDKTPANNIIKVAVDDLKPAAIYRKSRELLRNLGNICMNKRNNFILTSLLSYFIYTTIVGQQDRRLFLLLHRPS